MATPKNTAAEEAAKKAAEAAAAAAATQNAAAPATVATPVATATTPATPAPEQPEPAKAKAPFYKRPGFWLGVTAVTAIAAAFGVGYKKGEKAGRESASSEIEEDKIGAAIGAGIASANDHNSGNGGNSSNNSNSRDTNRRG